jgi:hypothetical protein
LILKREPTNKFDANAVAIYYGAKKLGYVPKGFAKELAPQVDQGAEFKYRVYKSPRPLPGVLRIKWEDGKSEPEPEAA